jgi:hypothetical protein
MDSIARTADATAVTTPAFALHWARELGAAGATLVQLQGGINNRVFRCGAGTTMHVIKGYSPAQPGQRDRMRAEVEFLDYAAQVAPQYVPRLIHRDRVRRCVVLEYVHGKPFPDGISPGQADVDAAVGFLKRLNADRRAGKRYITYDAADGFFRISDHMANVHTRVAQMGTDHLPIEARAEAADLLRRLADLTHAMARRTEALVASGATADAIDRDGRCISPSDFGFHNAIRTDGGLKFLDFEFAGWDDPAKAYADFVLQPRVPVRTSTFSLLSAVSDDETKVKLRCAVLGPILRLKWVCIILSVLQPIRLHQLQAINSSACITSLLKIRFKLAQEYFQAQAPYAILDLLENNKAR